MAIFTVSAGLAAPPASRAIDRDDQARRPIPLWPAHKVHTRGEVSPPKASLFRRPSTKVSTCLGCAPPTQPGSVFGAIEF
jgi:hypothetical protein